MYNTIILSASYDYYFFYNRILRAIKKYIDKTIECLSYY